MLRSLRFFALASACALSFAATAQQQTITFDNPTTPVTVTLLPSSQVQIGADGNLTAKCALDSGKCVGMPDGPTGGGPGSPTVTLTYSGGGTVTQGTAISITASVTNGQACVRQVTSGSPAGVWTGVFPANSSAGGTAVLSSAGTYGFQLKCYNDNGLAVSNTISVTATAEQTSNIDCNALGITPPTGFSQDAAKITWADVFSASAVSPPKTAGSALVQLALQRGKYASIRFTTPNPIEGSAIQWSDAQGSLNPAVLPNGVFFNISACPHDFQLRTTRVAGDPNSYPACRNYRGSSVPKTIQFKNATAADTNFECPLEPGKIYYLNYILADPRDGISSNPVEHGCVNPNDSGCGVLFIGQ